MLLSLKRATPSCGRALWHGKHGAHTTRAGNKACTKRRDSNRPAATIQIAAVVLCSLECFKMPPFGVYMHVWDETTTNTHESSNMERQFVLPETKYLCKPPPISYIMVKHATFSQKLEWSRSLLLATL